MQLENVSITRRYNFNKKGLKNVRWVYALKNDKSGKYSDSKYSIMRLAKELGMASEFLNRKMNQRDAYEIVSLAIAKGLIGNTRKSKKVFLIPFVERIWNFDSSPWIKYRNAQSGEPLKKAYVLKKLRSFQIHAKPFIEKNQILNSFSTADVITLQKQMADYGVSPDNINNAVGAISQAYQYGMQMQIVTSNPVTKEVRPFNATERRPQLFLREEVISILKELEKGTIFSASATTALLAIKLAVFGGMRMGEIRALKVNSIKPLKIDNRETDYYIIEINSSWDDIEKRCTKPKNKKTRYTAISKKLGFELLMNANKNPNNNGFVFFSTTSSTSPISKRVLEENLYDGINAIGISEEERKDRKLTFHLLRHFYVTEMKQEARRMEGYNEIIRQAVGHRSRRVNEEIYTHVTPADLLEIGVMSDHLLDIRL